MVRHATGGRTVHLRGQLRGPFQRGVDRVEWALIRRTRWRDAITGRRCSCCDTVQSGKVNVSRTLRSNMCYPLFWEITPRLATGRALLQREDERVRWEIVLTLDAVRGRFADRRRLASL